MLAIDIQHIPHWKWVRSGPKVAMTISSLLYILKLKKISDTFGFTIYRQSFGEDDDRLTFLYSQEGPRRNLPLRRH